MLLPNNKFNLLVACEFSGVVREAFNAYHGINAISCDLLPPEDGRVDYHYQGNVMDIINAGWNGMIFHAPCTFLCNSGVRWLYLPNGKHNNERWKEMYAGAEFFRSLLDADIPLIAGENPIPHRYARAIMGDYTQKIQPYDFGHGETKATCLWLKGLPPLIPTNRVEGREARVHKLPPSKNRWVERSRTLPGIADAMASQWVPVFLNSIGG